MAATSRRGSREGDPMTGELALLVFLLAIRAVG